MICFSVSKYFKNSDSSDSDQYKNSTKHFIVFPLSIYRMFEKCNQLYSQKW
jgi:hypothetical protein